MLSSLTNRASPCRLPCATDRNKEFLDRLARVHLSNPEFTIEEFARLMKLGRTVFYKKIRGVTGYSPNEYLRIMRMKKGAELLLSDEKITVAEVAYKPRFCLSNKKEAELNSF